MATRTVKSDSGNDLKLQNNGGTGSVTITDAGDLTIDSPADIVLDAEGADITLKDGGTAFGTLKQASGHLVIQPESSKEIIFNDGSGTASLTVDAANQHVSINNGNLVMGSAGGGIDFSSQSSPAGEMTSELLDHYEKGYVTPTIYGETSAGTTTYSFQRGRYTRIGNLVCVTCNVSITGQTGSGNLLVGGLPFVPVLDSSANPSADAIPGPITRVSGLTFSNQLTGIMFMASLTYGRLVTASSGSSYAQVGHDTFFDIAFSVTYQCEN